MTLAFILIGIGFLLLVGEMFIPTSGTLFVLAVVTIAVGVGMTFFSASDPSTGWITLLCVFVLFPTVSGVLLYYWPRTMMGKRMILRGPDEDATLATIPHHVQLEGLRGRFGKTLSDLRPAGVVDFDGRRIDVITEGMMVAPGQWVRCIDVQAGKVIVRQEDKPSLGDLENAIFERP
jgi:membrane-bound ClpP family serine protease